MPKMFDATLELYDGNITNECSNYPTNVVMDANCDNDRASLLGSEALILSLHTFAATELHYKAAENIKCRLRSAVFYLVSLACGLRPVK